MTVIGITGPTGAGKTTALQILAERNFETVDCDALYYQLLQSSPPLRQALIDAFGDVFLPNGVLNRHALAEIVFHSRCQLDRLNQIVFPAVSAAVTEKITNCSKLGVAIDAVNLVESGMGKLCDFTVAVVADPEVRLKRIMARDGLSEIQAHARIDAQKNDTWYREHCSFLLENQTDNPEACRTLMRHFFDLILKGMLDYGC